MHVQKLLDRLVAGDLGALDELIALTDHGRRAMSEDMLRRFPNVARWEEASDIAQRASLKLWQALQKEPPATAKEFYGLAALQTRQVLVDSARKHMGPLGLGANHDSVGTRDGASPALEGVDESNDPAALAEWTDFHEKIGRLPEDLRVPFDLLYYEGLTQDEAAAALEVSTRTVKRRWQAARLALSELRPGRPAGV